MENTAHGVEEQHRLQSLLWDFAFGVEAYRAQPVACCRILSGPPACQYQTADMLHIMIWPRGCNVSRAVASGCAWDRRAGGWDVGWMGCCAAGVTAQRATTPRKGLLASAGK